MGLGVKVAQGLLVAFNFVFVVSDVVEIRRSLKHFCIDANSLILFACLYRILIKLTPRSCYLTV